MRNHLPEEKRIVLTKELLKILKGKSDCSTAKVKLQLLKRVATENKVLLQLLIALDDEESLRESQERSLKEVINIVRTLSKALDDFDHSFFKLVKPVSYVPADVDVLIRKQEASRATRKLVELGYTVVVKEPYCTTLVKGPSIVDLYIHLTVGGVAYMDGQEVLEHVKTTEFNGIEIRTLESYAEALVVTARAIYKEGIYTLNDYFTVKRWLSNESFKLAERLNCEPALELAINLNEKIERGELGMPYKVPMLTWFMLLLRKVREDKLMRSTLLNVLKIPLSQRSMRLLASKLIKMAY